jgi:hypothetical protein
MLIAMFIACRRTKELQRNLEFQMSPQHYPQQQNEYIFSFISNLEHARGQKAFYMLPFKCDSMFKYAYRVVRRCFRGKWLAG